jgi:lactoylglutathione lyase
MDNPAPKVVGLRFELFVTDVPATITFFEATLGLVPPEGWSYDAYVPLQSGPVTIGVQTAENLRPEHHFSKDKLTGPRGVGVEIVIEVADVNEAFLRAVRAASELGVVCEPLVDRPWGVRDFRLIHPDGFYVRVTEVKAS